MADHKNSIVQLVSFRLTDRLFGVNILDVKEIYNDIHITPIDHADQQIRGYMNIRGQILLVIDLRSELGFENRDIPESAKVIVFKESVDEPFGILVDSVADVVMAEEEKITDRRAGEGEPDSALLEKRKAPQNLCYGVYPLENELMLVLNARGILGK